MGAAVTAHEPTAVDRLRERMLRAIVRSGWAGALGVALLAFALAFGLSAQHQQDARFDSLAAERTRLLKVAAAPLTPHLTDRARLANFYARFAPASDLSNVLAGIHVSADEFGLLPERGDYRSALVSGTPLVRITASLPMSGRFEDVHAWLATVMRADAGTSIDQLSIKRESPGTDFVLADVRLSVFVRGGE